jgi:hypothetical protein
VRIIVTLVCHVSLFCTMYVTCSDRELTKCDSVLYADSSTVGGQPSLSPRPVVETMTQLDSLLKKLEQIVMDVIKDIDNKKKVIMLGIIQQFYIRCAANGQVRILDAGTAPKSND